MTQISHFLIAHGGMLLFLLVLMDQGGLPFPAVPWLLAAGALAAGGQSSLWAAIGWSAAGCLAADAIWFYIGQHGNALFRVFPRLRAPRRAMEGATRARSILRGARILTASKFLPFGTVVPLRAGALKVSLPRFLLLDGLSSTFYSAVYVFLGFLFHNQLEEVVLFLQKLGVVAFLLFLIAVGLCLGAAILNRLPKQPRRPSRSGPAPTAPGRRMGGEGAHFDTAPAFVPPFGRRGRVRAGAVSRCAPDVSGIELAASCQTQLASANARCLVDEFMLQDDAQSKRGPAL
jgi:membrane protein DedA with SNARE-associated domain